MKTYQIEYVTVCNLPNRGDNFVKGFVVLFISPHIIPWKILLRVSLDTLGRTYKESKVAVRLSDQLLLSGPHLTLLPSAPPHSEGRCDRSKTMKLFLVI